MLIWAFFSFPFSAIIPCYLFLFFWVNLLLFSTANCECGTREKMSFNLRSIILITMIFDDRLSFYTICFLSSGAKRNCLRLGKAKLKTIVILKHSKALIITRRESEGWGKKENCLRKIPTMKTNKNDLIMLPRCRRKTNSNKWHCNVGTILKS